MKNYDIKSATAELSTTQKIVVNAKRIAFLVPNMFNKLSGGFRKKVENFKSSVDVQNALAEAEEVKNEVVENKIVAIEEKIERKEEAVAQTQADEAIPEKTKNYIVKAYEADIEELNKKAIRVEYAPRRLLISTVFIQKLFTNRRKRKEQERIEKVLSNVPTVEPVKEEAPTAVVNDVEAAKEKYLSLNNDRLEYMDEMKSIKAKIVSIQAEMTSLVNEFGLTKEMFEENLGGKTK